MTRKNALLLALVVGWTFLSGAPAHSKEGSLFVPAEFAAKPLGVADDFFRTVSLENFKNTKRVAIVMAAVTFKLESSINAKAVDMLGGSRTGIATASMSMNLGGVSRQALQDIADKFHDDLAAAFKELGVEVMTAEAIKAAPAYAAVQELNDPDKRKPYVDKNFLGYRATLVSVTGHDAPLMGTGMTGMAGGFNAFKKLSDDLGEGTTIIAAHLTVDFVSMSKGGGLLARSATVSGKPTLQVVRGQFYLQRGLYQGFTQTKQQILSDDDYAIEVKSGGKEGFTDWFSGNASSRSSHQVVADEAKYKTGVGNLLNAGTQMFIAQIKKAAY